MIWEEGEISLGISGGRSFGGVRIIGPRDFAFIRPLIVRYALRPALDSGNRAIIGVAVEKQHSVADGGKRVLRRAAVTRDTDEFGIGKLRRDANRGQQCSGKAE